MPGFIDYRTADLSTLLSDKYVQQLLEIAEKRPDWTVSEMVSHLASGSRRRAALSYQQASLILRRLNLSTPSQRKMRLAKTTEWEKASLSDQELLSNNFPDFALFVKHRKHHREQVVQEQLSQDITSLLSDHSVQQLLDIVYEHPAWTNKQIFENQPKHIDGTPVLTYTDVTRVLQRLHLDTIGCRLLQKVDVDRFERAEKEKRHQELISLYPNFLSYLEYRKQYRDFKKQQKIHEIPLSVSSKVTPPISAPASVFPPAFKYAPAQQSTFRTFDKFFSLTRQFSFLIAGVLLYLLAGSLLLDYLFRVEGIVQKIGMFFSFTAFTFGLFFLLYSLKYYLTIALLLSFSRSPKDGKRTTPTGSFLSRLFGFSVEIREAGGGKAAERKPASSSLSYDLSTVTLERHPFVSIHVATFNEKRVIDRFLLAATAMNYDNFEIIVADDSTDETVQLLEQWKTHPRVKISHRETREGYKGGALKHALTQMDPRTEYVLVFDALPHGRILL